MKIAVCGTHGIGKSTLTKWISEEYNLPMLSEQAGKLLKTDFPFYETERDFSVFKQFQETVLDNQLQSEENSPQGFVADRSIIDSLAYVHVRTLIERDMGWWLEEYAGRVRENLLGRYDLIIFVRYDEHFLGSDPEIRNMNPVFMKEIDRFLDYSFSKLHNKWLNVVEVDTIDFSQRKEIVSSRIKELQCV